MATYGKQIGNGSGGGGGSGFTSDVIIQQPNSASAEVNTLELKNQYVSNTAGSETADWDVIVPVAGTQRTLKLGRANLAARQTATTVGATDSIAVNPRSDLVVVTMGVDATSLTFAGLDLDTDFEYEFVGQPVLATGTMLLRLNGDVGGWTGSFIYSLNGGATTTIAMPSLTAVDSADAASAASFRATISGAPGVTKQGEIVSSSLQGGNRYGERLFGFSGGTTNVTSVVFTGGTFKATSVITMRRTRAVAV